MIDQNKAARVRGRARVRVRVRVSVRGRWYLDQSVECKEPIFRSSAVVSRPSRWMWLIGEVRFSHEVNCEVRHVK